MTSSEYEVVNCLFNNSNHSLCVVKKKGSNEQFLMKYCKFDDTGIELARRNRYKRELEFISTFDHPNVFKPLTSENKNFSLSIIYSYRKGTTLQRFLDAKTTLGIAEKLKMMIQLVEALEYIHSRGIIHGDLHPGNIFIREDRGVEIYDFSMCMTLEESERRPDGLVSGTYPYLSPEQTGFTRFKVDTRSDLYCAGIILYQFLSNHFPFSVKTGTIEELLDFMLKTELEPIRTIPYYINEILLKALRCTPEERYQTASGLKYDLKMALDIILNETDFQVLVPGEKDTVIAVSRLRFFIAREKEIENLNKGLNALKQKESATYLLTGISGIGKTEIIRSFLASVAINSVFVIGVRCNRFTPKQPYSAIRSLFLDFLHKLQDKDTKDKEMFKMHLNVNYQEYSGLICDVIPEMKVYFDSVQYIEWVDKQRKSDRITFALVSILDLICASFPALLIIDDLQWIDSISFDLLMKLKFSNAAKMMIFAYQTESPEDKHVFRLPLYEVADKQIEILPFSRNEIVWLVFSIFDKIQNDNVLIDVLEHRCCGNPFVLNQMLRYLLDSSIIRKVDGNWVFMTDMVSEIPNNFDTISIIKHKLDNISEREYKYLKIGSLMSGDIQQQILEEIGGFDEFQSRSILKKLESDGFLSTNFKGEIRFAHDMVQQIIMSNIADDEKLLIYEALANEYEALSEHKMEYLFDAAEMYRKTSQIDKAIELSVKAGKYAVKKAAYDSAVTDFSNALEMINQVSIGKQNNEFDRSRIELSLAEALMLAGKYEKALGIYNRFIENEKTDNNEHCDILYNVGCIYFNLGEHFRAQDCFCIALSIIGINIRDAQKRNVLNTLIQLLMHLIYSSVVYLIIPKKDDYRKRQSVKILTKYVQALSFTDLNSCLYPHLLAFNTTRGMGFCIEKLELLLQHSIVSYLIYFKRSSFKYLKKVISIARQSRKKSLIAYTKAVSGVLYFYSAKWKKSEKDFLESISDSKTCGDNLNTITCLDYLSRIDFYRGDLKRALEHLNHAISFLDKSNYYKVEKKPILAFKCLIESVCGHVTNNQDHSLLFLSDTDTPLLIQIRLNLIHLEYDILKGNIFEAWQVCQSLYPVFSGFYLNTEFAMSYYNLTCELISRELINQKTASSVIKDRKTMFDFYRRSLKMLLCFSSKYPAYKGIAYRYLGWYLYLLHNRKRITRFLMNMSIRYFHGMQMRTEEARSLRDYGLFNDQCNLSGLALDQYDAAFNIFKQCGAQFEINKILDKISSEKRKVYLESSKNSLMSAENSNQIRFDTLLQISSSISEITDVSVLLDQILNGMIKATGAQYGCIFVKGENKNIKCMLMLDYQGNELNDDEMIISKEIIKTVEENKQIILINDGFVKNETGNRKNNEKIRSVLCVPFCREENLLGYVYLGNDKVAGLFSENAVKTAQILSAQAGILLENANFIEQYKKLNRELDNKVKFQTHDIKEKNRQLEIANLKLVESERVKGVLSGTLVHDIKNYAAGIEGNLQYLGRRLEQDFKIKRVLDVVSETCTDIVSLASNVLDIAKMDEGKMVVRAEKLDSSFIANLAEKFIVNTLFEEKRIHPVVLRSEEKFCIDADVYLLERVLQNLFSNAAKYVPRDGNVELRFIPEDKENILCFFNSGLAIPEKEREVLFEKYARIEYHHSQYSKGLGLFFCRMVMNAHKGRIWVESDENGNVFKLAFPRIDENEKTLSLS